MSSSRPHPTPPHLPQQLRSIHHVFKFKECHHPDPTPPHPSSCVASTMCASPKNVIMGERPGWREHVKHCKTIIFTICSMFSTATHEPNLNITNIHTCWSNVATAKNRLAIFQGVPLEAFCRKISWLSCMHRVHSSTATPLTLSPAVFCLRTSGAVGLLRLRRPLL